MTKNTNIALPIAPPSAISLITTNRCTAACTDCCFACSPKKHERLSLEQMKLFSRTALQAYPTIKLGVITGGECFTIGDDLFKIIEYMQTLCLHIRVVTNGSWATSLSKARSILNRLIQAGLGEINFSTGDFHQEWVPLRCVVNGIIAAVESQINVVVNVEAHSSNNFTANQLKNAEELQPYINSPYLKIISGKWISSEDRENTINSFQSNLRCRQLFSTITLNYNGDVLSCCGLTTKGTSYFNVGQFNPATLQAMWERQYNDFLKIWLYTEGPEMILQFASQYQCTINQNQLRGAHICEFCHKIVSNKEILKILNKEYRAVLPNVIMKYTILQTPKILKK